MPLLEVEEIVTAYGSIEALKGVSLEVGKGKLTAVMGPSGSGKSTLMHILAGLDKPTSGTVQIAGTEITRLEDSQLTMLRRKHIGFVFQFFNLLPMLDAEENVVLPLSIAGEKPDKAWLDELLGKMGLADRRRHRPSELSGGEQQRVAVARALANNPRVILADEPTGNLDTANSERAFRLLQRIVREERKALLLVTHNPLIAEACDWIHEMRDGVIVGSHPRGSSARGTR